MPHWRSLPRFSMPDTDMAASFLVREALDHQPAIQVINLVDGDDKANLKNRYRKVLPFIPEDAFVSADARAWIRANAYIAP